MFYGAVAQLGERCVRNAEVEGSIPFRSTILHRRGGFPAAFSCRQRLAYPGSIGYEQGMEPDPDTPLKDPNPAGDETATPVTEPETGASEMSAGSDDTTGGTGSASADGMPPPPVEVKSKNDWTKNVWIKRGFRFVAGIALILVTLCMYISRIPPVFDVDARARERAIDMGHIEADSTRRLPTGYTTVATTIELAEWLLDPRRGGYLSNDRFSPAIFVDNIRNFEYGMVIQLRDFVHSLRQDFSRSRAQSLEREELIEAEARFNFNHNSWIIPSTESQYREGIRFLEVYLEAIANSGPESRVFVARQDQLEGWLRRQQFRLGSFGFRMRQNATTYQFNPFLDRSDIIREIGELGEEPEGFLNQYDPDRTTPWRMRDDEFYEIRGSVFVMYHTMLALRTDYESILNDFNGMGLMNRILSELYAASSPMVSPVVLNGSEYGFVHNHSLTMAAHVTKAHLAIQDLRILLRGGSDL